MKPGEKKFMSLGEFVELLKRAGVFENENLLRKDAYIVIIIFFLLILIVKSGF